MKLLIGVLFALIWPKMAFSEMMEMKCDEIKAISYYDRYYGTKCTISDISADSSSTFAIRSANNFEYSKIIQEVEFTKSKLYDMPREIFGTFQFLKKVVANACGIEDVNKYNFNYAVSLQELRMRSNKIKLLPNSAFSTVTTLQTLDLTSNEISKIEATAFAGLESLEYLTLSSNQLVSIDESVLKDLTSLISLRLDSNKLQVIEENLFANNLNLSEIRLDTNEIAIINGDAFGKLKKLKLLNLSTNRLRKIDILNTNLERLWIPYNKLKVLDVNKNLKLLSAPYNELEAINFTGNTELVELKLRQNAISDLSSFVSLAKVEILDLSYNPLGVLNISSFSRMVELVKINLEFSNITQKSLTFGTFAHNTNLTHMDLSYNQLQRIDFSMLTSLTQLTHLKVDGNNLTEMPYKNIKKNFPKLSLISLVDNDWSCSYLSEMVKHLRSLNVIVYVFAKFRVYEETNVDGIRCHHNNSEHTYWSKAIVHKDDDEGNDASVESPTDPENSFIAIKSNLTKVWNKVSELQYFMSRLKTDLNDYKQSLLVDKQPLKGNQPIDEVVQSEVSSIKVILCLMFFIMIGFTIAVIIKYVKVYVSEKRFYYPSDGFRRSTATIATVQTTMEAVM
jgi:Leucine-rich repeat (LRR) protein